YLGRAVARSPAGHDGSLEARERVRDSALMLLAELGGGNPSLGHGHECLLAVGLECEFDPDAERGSVEAGLGAGECESMRAVDRFEDVAVAVELARRWPEIDGPFA